MSPIPVRLDWNKVQEEVVSAGELGYWPTAMLLHLLGPTPAKPGRRDSSRQCGQYHWKVSGTPKLSSRLRMGAKIVLEKSRDKIQYPNPNSKVLLSLSHSG